MYPKLVRDALAEHIAPVLEAMDFVRRGRSRQVWTRGRLQIRVIIDPKARDPYTGGAFTLEFEVSDDGRFEHKLAGRVRLVQLLDGSQRSAFIGVRNAVARRSPIPPEDEIADMLPSLRNRYFEESDELEKDFWMRFRTAEDVDDWCVLIVAALPTLVDRARQLPAHEFLLSSQIGWP
jgi:hypothetical protein